MTSGQAMQQHRNPTGARPNRRAIVVNNQRVAVGQSNVPDDGEFVSQVTGK